MSIRPETCWHEAGHAITAAALGGEVFSVEVTPEGKSGGRIRTAMGFDHPGFAPMLAGGIVAERLACKSPGWWQERGDRKLLTKWARRWNIADEVGAWRQAKLLAAEILIAHGGKWVNLAEALLRRGNLSGPELGRLLPKQTHRAQAMGIFVGGCAGRVLLSVAVEEWGGVTQTKTPASLAGPAGEKVNHHEQYTK
jgi:hypothetical protein